MTFRSLCRELAYRLNMPVGQVHTVCRGLLDVITEHLAVEDKIRLPGLGNFVTVVRRGRIKSIRNLPRLKAQDVVVTTRRYVKFRPYGSLSDRLKSDGVTRVIGGTNGEAKVSPHGKRSRRGAS